MAPLSAHAATLADPNTSALSSGFIGYWPLDGETTNWSTGTTLDLSGQGNNGAITGLGTTTAVVPGKIGEGFKFVRNNVTSSSWIKVPDSTSLEQTGSGSFTVGFWLKPTVICDSVNNQNYVEKPQDSSTPGWGIYMDGGTCTLKARLAYTGSHIDVNVSTPNVNANFATSTWTQAVLVVNRGTNQAQWYLNGAAVGSATNISSLGDMTNTIPLDIGSGLHGLGVDTIGGVMDDVRIYNRALSASEIALLYAAGQAHVGSSPTNALTNGLVGYWPLDGSTLNWKTGAVSDRSGNSLNGSIAGLSTSSAPTQGKIGQALRFGNGNTYISVPHNAALIPSSVSVSAWVKRTSNSEPAIAGIVSKYCGGSGSWAFRLQGGTNKFNFTDGTTNIYTTGAVPLNQWTFLTATFNGSGNTATLYINGVQDLQTTLPEGILPGTAPLCIGTDFLADGTRNFIGSIDDVRVYNRVLSPTEVAQLYATGAVHVDQSSTAAVGSGLVGYWTFDGSAMNWKTGTVADSSGNGNTGNIVGLSTTTAPTQGKSGQALKFTTNTYINLPYGFSQPTVLTESVWFKTSATGVALLGQSSSAPTAAPSAYVPALCINASGQLRGEIWTGAVGGITTTGAVNNNKWHLAVLVGNVSTQSLYLDGALVGSRVGAISQSWWLDTTIGAGYDGDGGRCGGVHGWDYFNGSIDNVHIYNRALSASEVQLLYKEGE